MLFQNLKRKLLRLAGGVGLVAAMGLAGAMPVLAQSGVSAWNPGQNSQAIIQPDGSEKRLELAVGQGRTIVLPFDVEEVAVVNPEIVDVVPGSPRRVHILARAIGKSDVMVAAKEDGGVVRLSVQVSPDLKGLDAALSAALPESRILATPLNDSIILSGTVFDPAQANLAGSIARRFVAEDANLINSITILGRQQVLLKVRVSEVQRSALKDFGFQSVLTGDGGDLRIATAVSGLDLAVDQVSATASLGGANLNAVLNALEKQGLVKTLAEPNLTAVSGETADMLAGGEFPIPVAQQSDTITIEYKKFGVSLGFTPTVLSDDSVSLKVAVEVSAINEQNAFTINNITLPALTVRRATTSVDLPSGGAMVMAGLLQNDIRDVIQGIPGLMDVPILGALFSSKSFQRDQTELVVTVEAYLVRPVDAAKLALPTDGVTPAGDFDRYFLNRITSVYGDGRTAMPAAMIGPFGYIVE